MDFKKTLRNFNRLVFPAIQIGGLEVTDSVINFYDILGGSALIASLRLTPGIVEDGKVKNGEGANFTEALKTVHSQITINPKKNISVILTLQSNNVYVQSFNVSKAAESNLEEAAELNLRMISPMPIEKTYYGWQRIADNGAHGGSIELLGAFMPSAGVDSIVTALHEANFSVAAVEFSALSLVRQLVSLKKINNNLSYLVMHVTAEGLDFVVVKNNNVYFNYFHPWRLVQADARSITLANMEMAVNDEVSKVLNFYLGRSGNQIKDMIVVTPLLGEEIVNAVTKKFKDIKTSFLSSEEVTAVSGAAIRGLVPRYKDTNISLTGESAVKIFEEQEVLEFTYLWRKVAITVVSFILLVFSAGYIYLSGLDNKLTTKGIQTGDTQVVASEFTSLQAKATDFNRTIDLVKSVQKSDVKITPFLNYLNQLMGSSVSFDKLTIQSLSSPVVVSGVAQDSNSVLDFKKKLDSQKQFANISVPLSDIAMRSDNKVSFRATFLINDLNFPEKAP